jgi:hypothetical protein
MQSEIVVQNTLHVRKQQAIFEATSQQLNAMIVGYDLNVWHAVESV